MAEYIDDLVLEEVDTDENGVVDFGIGDLDGNGVDDIYLCDFNEDGIWDSQSLDADEDGIDESFEVDENYDGQFDRIEFYDAAGNLVGSDVDTDGDGVVDQRVYDSDGDGAMDTFEYDTNGDGQIDDVNVVTNPYEGQGGVSGEAEDEFHQYMGEVGLCGPASAAMIISEQTGEAVTYLDVAHTAAEMGIVVPVGPGDYSGTFAQGMVDVLGAYGVESTVQYGDLSMLEGFLAEGRDVMVAVDADEVWGDGDESVTANHFLVVTEIDEERGVVTLNDPATQEAYEVPLDTFVNAWADGSNEMVVTDTGGVDDDGFTDFDDLNDIEDLVDRDDDGIGLDDLGLDDYAAVKPGPVFLTLLLQL